MVEAAISGSALILLLLAVRAVFKKHLTSRFRCALWALALLRLLYAQSAQPPMVLDDSFARLDGKRLLALLSVLARTSAENGTQIFLFACTPRERLLLDKLGEPYTRLDWKKV